MDKESLSVIFLSDGSSCHASVNDVFLCLHHWCFNLHKSFITLQLRCISCHESKPTDFSSCLDSCLSFCRSTNKTEFFSHFVSDGVWWEGAEEGDQLRHQEHPRSQASWDSTLHVAASPFFLCLCSFCLIKTFGRCLSCFACLCKECWLSCLPLFSSIYLILFCLLGCL